jgi:hypothetical protein
MLGVGQEVDSRAAFVSKKKYNDVASGEEVVRTGLGEVEGGGACDGEG